ncbi:MAG: site-2 protease family protein [Ruminococcaceae bacterium]|nr:site-2 protease family protein [Oscillospiraceae bacterium]
MFNVSSIPEIVISLFAVLLTLTIHEYSHGYAAYKLGDDTAKMYGRLTLNPIKHLDPIGALCMLFFHFGWAKPVPINPRNFKNPKRDFAITALAGPLSNIIMAFLSAFIFLLIYAPLSTVAFESRFWLSVVQNTLDFFYIFHLINIGIAIFNLIPIPPLDGSRILNVILPPKTYFAIMKYERTIYYVLLGWLLLGDLVVAGLLSVPMIAYNPVLSSIVRVFSLSDILGFLISKISSFIFYLWELIPFLKA